MACIDCIFVYGTLRPGQPGHALVAPWVVACRPATTRGQLVALPEGFPGLIPEGCPGLPNRGDGAVAGEVLTLSDPASALAALDRYEGDEYRRAVRDAALRDGSSIAAWCYVLLARAAASRSSIIESGDWLQYVRSG